LGEPDIVVLSNILDEDRELFELGYSMIHNVYVAESGQLDQNLKHQFNEYAEKDESK